MNLSLFQLTSIFHSSKHNIFELKSISTTNAPPLEERNKINFPTGHKNSQGVQGETRAAEAFNAVLSFQENGKSEEPLWKKSNKEEADGMIRSLKEHGRLREARRESVESVSMSPRRLNLSNLCFHSHKARAPRKMPA